MPTITPFLWFDNQLEAALQFYTSIFKDAEILQVNRSPAAEPGQEGAVFTATFRLNGQEFMALNGGPHFTFTPAISMFVNCDTQAEVDELWEKLSAGGELQQCGWLTDRYGLSWQIIPSALGEMLQDKDPERSRRVMEAMLKMIKIDVAALRQAYDAASYAAAD
jgi:predicted 3-demethylubiquinone-9 3-methyltransferase (glyoxalase superfamily)